ncbi:MAG TPA: DUF885 domain-containing protein [Candidatus Limnocylindrales bacterium]|nr:DUF885 domain-containing protein [Candidatus Limnocylindrales bacterium]
MSAFTDRVDAFLAEFFRLNPLHATAAGLHDHDGRWPDLTRKGREERLAFVDRWATELGALDAASLSSDERIDRDLLRLELDAQRFGDTELREEAWNPLEWVYILGGGIFPLLAREFAPLPVRLTSIAERLEGVPALLAAARENLVGAAGRPVARFHTETALKQLSGIAELADDAVTAADDASSDVAVAGVADRVRAAAATAKEALSDFEAHLRDVVLPASEGEGRIGGELFAAKMRHTIRDEELAPDRVLAAAEREYVAVRGEMIRLARELWPRWGGGASMPDDEGHVVRSVLDAIAAEHPPAPELLDFCRAELERIEAFCRERSVIGLSDEPLDIRWTPVFLRAFGGAMLDSPGPLDKGQKSFFAITPIPEDWTPEQAESYLREDNARMLRLLTIHEAVPGHYLQGAYANRCESISRAVFWSGVFAEGWAVYVTQVMMDLGYGADDPGLMLTHWKFYLRAVTNAIIDVRIHTAGMTEGEAVSLMVDGGFQEEAEARNKYNRARLSSVQLSTYFVGSLAFWEIEQDARRRAARTTADAREDAVPAPRVVGGFGDTPGFDYRAHLEACISHGSPPMSLLRRILLPD